MKVQIEIPEGHEIDQITFKPIVKPLPKTWEELKEVVGYYISSDSIAEDCFVKADDYGKNVFATKQQAEASIALAQLSQLMRVYNDGWEPNWNKKHETKHAIYLHDESITHGVAYNSRIFLTFKTNELAKQFAENFKDLILIAKPLL